MHEPVYRMIELLCAVVFRLPVGTNLGLLHLLWMLVSGRLLTARGAVFGGLSEAGLSGEQSRRAWAALGRGQWSSAELIEEWERLIEREGRWQATEYGGTGRWPRM